MKNILKKLWEVGSEIEKMSKDGYNSNSNYRFLSETQITETIHRLFAEKQIVFFYDCLEDETITYQSAKGNTMFMVKVKVAYAFYDVETGESLAGHCLGHGADVGDKGIYKAITGAIKYLYMKTFSIPTGDDAENETPQVEGKAERKVDNSQPFGSDVCGKCGAPMKLSKKGTKYCSALCWMSDAEKQAVKDKI